MCLKIKKKELTFLDFTHNSMPQKFNICLVRITFMFPFKCSTNKCCTDYSNVGNVNTLRFNLFLLFYCSKKNFCIKLKIHVIHNYTEFHLKKSCPLIKR